jgi:hypothetical protein
MLKKENNNKKEFKNIVCGETNCPSREEESKANACSKKKWPKLT